MSAWVGLEKSDMPDGEDPMYDHPFFIQGIVWAATKLFEKNHMIDDDDTQVYRSELEAAVKAAIEAEREACAKVCDEMESRAEGTECCKWPTPADCAYAIRARGERQ